MVPDRALQGLTRVAALAVSLLATSVGAGDWPQWRGPGRDGVVSSADLPEPWPERLTLLWERDVGGGYSGPVVVGDSVWVHTSRNGRELVTRLRLPTGEEVWQRSYEVDFRQDESARQHGEGPFSTPSVADGRLFTLSITAVLSAWDAETGRLLWRRASGDEFDPSYPYFGAASSPLVWEGLLFVHFGGHYRIDSIPQGPGAMLALDAADGKERWRWTGDGPACGASPQVRTIGGRTQLVAKTQKKILGLDARTGRELWRIPYQVPMDNTISDPLVLGDRLLSSDYDMGTRAWKIEESGTGWAARALYSTREVSPFMSSPVHAAGLVVGFSGFRKGQLFVLDPEDGKVLWRAPPRSGDHASLLSSGDQVLAFLDDGWLVVGRVSRQGFETLRRYRLGESNGWTYPALAGGRLLTKDGARLRAYDLRAR